jgi:hypothetical protein
LKKILGCAAYEEGLIDEMRMNDAIFITSM